MTVVDISDNIHKMIVAKQSELFNVEGKKRTLAEIVEKSIMNGIHLIKIKNEEYENQIINLNNKSKEEVT